MLCYNSSVKDDGSGLSFVYELFIRSTYFSLDAEQSVLYLLRLFSKNQLPISKQVSVHRIISFHLCFRFLSRDGIPFPRMLIYFLNSLDFCIMLLNARTSSSVIFSSGICI